MASMRALTRSSSALVAISGTMTSGTTGLPVFLADVDRRLENGARLHLGDLRIGNGDAAAAEAEHRIELGQLLRAAGELLRVGAHGLGHLGDLLLAVRQEFVQRRIEQADGDRPAVHDLEQLDEIGALHRQQLGERGAARFLVVGEDHLAHRLDAVLVEEHVLGAAEPDAFGAEAHAPRAASAGVSALARTPSLRALSAQPISVANSPDSCGSIMSTLPASTWPVEPSTVMKSPLLEGLAAGRHGAGGVIDADRAGAGDAGLAHAARHHGGVRGHAAARGENAFGGVHAVDVLGRGFDPHQDHLLAVGFQVPRLRRS